MKYDYQTKIIYGEHSLDESIRIMGNAGYRVAKIDRYETGRDIWDEFNNQKNFRQRQYVVIFEKEITEKPKKEFVQIKVR